jgi:hypothetical protein
MQYKRFEDLPVWRDAAELAHRSEKISKQLYGWIESLENSEIPGRRRLDDKAKNRYTSKRSGISFWKS